jgi:hypothetical protein
MAPVGFEPTMSAGERPQIYVLGREDTGTRNLYIYGRITPKGWKWLYSTRRHNLL